ncbi:DegT/DnrJ/EryC1/StrS family aminotransferase [Rhodospirillales bacterium]|nr:DegT/DnrJ/EryC1/StrS family aminotransferase [Rhodospirillales bacterium]
MMIRREVPLAKPYLDNAEAQAAQKTILSGWVTQGPQVFEFEKEFSELVGAKHACAVTNCTTALHLALKAVGVGHRDEVITVSYTFVATANSIRQLGAKPVFIDVEATTYNLDPKVLETAITSKTAAILVVHQFGMPCNLDAIIEIAKFHNIPVVEDAACAIGSKLKTDNTWENIGKPHGSIACFSFHPRKVITAGEGGMITTNDPELDRRVRLWRHHSMSISDLNRSNSENITFDSFEETGYNYRMTDIQAAILRQQLLKLPEIIQSRRRLADRYNKKLAKKSDIITPIESEKIQSNWQTYSVILPAWADQMKVMQMMLDEGVQTRRSTICCHLENAHSKTAIIHNMATSEYLLGHSIALPLYPQMSDHDQDYVVDTLLKSIEACKT